MDADRNNGHSVGRSECKQWGHILNWGGGLRDFKKNQHFQVSLTYLGSEVVFAAHATGGGTSVNKMHN